MKKNNQKGVALIISIMLLSLVLFLVIYFLSFSITENKISRSQLSSNDTYYLSEAAVNDVIWKLQNDTTWQSLFVSSSTWATSTTRVNPLGYSGSYSVKLINYNTAHANVYATSSINLPNGRVSQRVIKVNIYRATGEASLGNNAMIADGNITISNCDDLHFNGGVHANGNVVFSNGGDIEIDGNLEATGTYTISGTPPVVDVRDLTYASNKSLGPAAYFPLPAIDFNSAATTSMKSKAVKKYTASEFKNLLDDKDDYTLSSGITYVTGNVTIDEDDLDLTIPGALVVEGSLYLEIDFLEIKHSSGKASGLYSTGNMTLKDINDMEEDDESDAVLYTNSTLTLNNVGGDEHDDWQLNGGIAAKTISMTNCRDTKVNLNSTIVKESIPGYTFSPIVSTDHWEEQY